MPQPLYTTVPEVKAKLQDTVLPAAVASLAATITVAGEVVALRKPDIAYGNFAQFAPDAYIAIGTTAGVDTNETLLPVTHQRPQTESYQLPLLIWYAIGDRGANAQRIATESGYAVFRAITAQVVASPSPFADIVGPGGWCRPAGVTDREFDSAEGRAVGLICNLIVNAKV